MNRIAERVEECGDLRIEGLVMPPDVGLGDEDVVGECTGEVDSDSPSVLAQVTTAGQAVATAIADHVALRPDELADLEA
ncbi:hypothetical protein D3C83_170290 [compost metagenome]